MRRRHAQGRKVRPSWTVAAIAPRDRAPGATRHVVGDGCHGDRLARASIDACRGLPHRAMSHARLQGGALQKHGQVRRDAERIGQFQAMQRLANGRDIAKFRIADDGGHVEAGRPHTAEQPERMPPFLLKRDGRRDARADARLGRQPLLGEIQHRAQKPGAHPGPERHRCGDLAIGDLAQRATVLPRRAHRMWAMFRKARPVENQHAAALGNDLSQATPEAVGVPGRVRNEVLKGLIGDRLGDAREHGLHRLPLAVAEHALHIAPQDISCAR